MCRTVCAWARVCLLSVRGHSRIHRSERLRDGLAVSSKIAVPGEVCECDRVPLPVQDKQAAPPVSWGDGGGARSPYGRSPYATCSAAHTTHYFCAEPHKPSEVHTCFTCWRRVMPRSSPIATVSPFVMANIENGATPSVQQPLPRGGDGLEESKRKKVSALN